MAIVNTGFGDDPKTSVLNSDCRAHDVENLYVTDASFMPTGGSVHIPGRSTPILSV